MSLSAGTKIGPYEIVAPIGAGGMGEVYLAQDHRLGRKVALKFLSDKISSNDQARRRFLKEARAASILNNPHIVTVYDILSEKHSDVIVMEYMEGESLRKLLERGKLEIKRSLEIAADVAVALSAAHNAGIIHRDIKPENILITRTGVTKVLDFGLAKLLMSEQDTHASQIATGSIETRAGAVLGTVAYMSPEQAQGQPLDHRTDIFSLGIVLFEMLSGVRPFQGNSVVDTLHAIVHQEPQSNPRGVWPNDLSDIVSRALAKSAEERYQHAGDFAWDLRKAKRYLETGTTPRAETPIGQNKNIWKYLFFVAVALVGLAALFFWKSQEKTAETSAAASHEDFALTPVTVDPGYEWGPTFSPDGETIAYVSDRTGNFDIFLKQISGGPDINLTNHPADDVQPAFSPDGKQIAFVSTRTSSGALHYPGSDGPLVGGDIWIMPAFGGSAKRIVENANFPTWSRDGTKILYTSGPWFGQSLSTISVSGGTTEIIAVNFRVGSPARLMHPVYSPLERWVLFSANNNIFIVSSKGGEPRILLKGTCPTWRGADKFIYSNALPGKNFSLWEASFSEEEGKIIGNPRPLTVGQGRDLDASVSRDGSRIAFASVDFSSNLELMPFDAENQGPAGESRAITAGNDIIYFAHLSPDGATVAFASQRGSNSHIWKTDSEMRAVQLTSDAKYFDGYPRYSPDGQQILFFRREANNLDSKNDIWIMAADGANPRRVVEISQEATAVVGFFSWNPTGQSLVYRSSTDAQLYSYDFHSKGTKRLTNEPRLMPVISVSSDGKWIVYQSTIRGNVDVRAIPMEGGEARFVVSTPHQDYHPFLSPSGKWLYFQYDHKNLYRVPGPAQNWITKEPEKITNFPESGLFLEDPQISNDGKQLLYSRAKITGDVWILSLQK